MTPDSTAVHRAAVHKERINAALQHQDAIWGFHQMLTSEDREWLDALLVEHKHPLAYEAGSQWYRFRELKKSGWLV